MISEEYDNLTPQKRIAPKISVVISKRPKSRKE